MELFRKLVSDEEFISIEEVGKHRLNSDLSPVDVEVFQKMTYSRKFRMMCELSEFTHNLFKIGLRQQYPDLSEEERHQKVLDGLQRCCKNNY